jgi:transposase
MSSSDEGCGRCGRLSEVQEVASRFEVDDELWAIIEPLIPPVRRRFRYPGRRRSVSDRQALNAILFVLHTGIAWRDVPQELGYGSGVTAWRRLDEWQKAGVWERIHHELLVRLQAVGEIDWSRAVADSSHNRALLGGSTPGPRRSTVPARAPSTTC